MKEETDDVIERDDAMNERKKKVHIRRIGEYTVCVEEKSVIYKGVPG